jgi:hypothetical protein
MFATSLTLTKTTEELSEEHLCGIIEKNPGSIISSHRLILG